GPFDELGTVERVGVGIGGAYLVAEDVAVAVLGQQELDERVDRDRHSVLLLLLRFGFGLGVGFGYGGVVLGGWAEVGGEDQAEAAAVDDRVSLVAGEQSSASGLEELVFGDAETGGDGGGEDVFLGAHVGLPSLCGTRGRRGKRSGG